MEPCPLTEEWLYSLLSRLWERGLHYNYNYVATPLTWDEELHVFARGVIGSEVYDNVSLSDVIQRIAASGAGSIKMYDKEVILHLFLGPRCVELAMKKLCVEYLCFAYPLRYSARWGHPAFARLAELCYNTTGNVFAFHRNESHGFS